MDTPDSDSINLPEKSFEDFKEQFQTFFNNSLLGIYRSAPTGEILLANPAFVEILGYSSYENLISGFKHAVILNNIERKRFRDAINEKGILKGFESKWITQNGNTKWLRENARIIKNENGKIIYFEGIVEDITESRLAERRMTKTGFQMKMIWDYSLDGMRLTNSDGFIIKVNKAYCKMVKMDEYDLIGKHYTEVYEEKFRKYLLHTQNNRMDLNAPHLQEEVILWNKEKYWFEISYSLLNSEDEQNLILGIFRDITEIKEATKLQNSIFDISEAANTTKDLMDLYSSIHQIIKELMPANNFYLALYDEKSDMLEFPYYVDEVDAAPVGPEKAGKGMTEYVIHSGTDLLVKEADIYDMIRSGKIEMIGTPSKVWLGVALKLLGRTMGVMVIQDYHNEAAYNERDKQLLVFVSEQIASAIDKKRTEAELHKYTEELKKINESKDKFFSIMAHDLKSPFMGLLGFSNILVEDLDTMPTEQIRYFVEGINTSCRNVFSLLENLLEWSRFQLGRMEFKPAEITLNRMIDDEYHTFLASLNEKQISFLNHVEEGLCVKADEVMLKSVIHNLISNAIKFTQKEGEIVIYAERETDKFIISIMDNGVGINDATKAKLFRIDTQVSTYGTGNEKGTGLGLLLCKEMVEKHGGEIWVESQTGKGTTFYFTIPIA